MKTETLRMALEMLEARGDYDEQTWTDIRDALQEIDDIEQADIDDGWQGQTEVHLITIQDSDALINKCLYDTYGKLRKQTIPRDPLLLPNFHQRSKDVYGFEHWTFSAIRDGFEFVNDLWHDNEVDGANNPDGTFKQHDPDVLVLLDDILCDAIDDADCAAREEQIRWLKRQLNDWLK